MRLKMRQKQFQAKGPKAGILANFGFTLMELMIALTVVAILLAVAVPAISQYRDRHQFSGAMLDVLASLRRARASAVELNRDVVFVIDTTARTYRAFVDDGSGDEANAFNLQLDDGERVLFTETLPRGVTFESPAPLICFNARGFPVNAENEPTGGTIRLNGNLGSTRSITLLISGHSSIE
jgi:prepilin-type N-terminal cleavage/methylation domain-containing protein